MFIRLFNIILEDTKKLPTNFYPPNHTLNACFSIGKCPLVEAHSTDSLCGIRRFKKYQFKKCLLEDDQSLLNDLFICKDLFAECAKPHGLSVVINLGLYLLKEKFVPVVERVKKELTV